MPATPESFALTRFLDANQYRLRAKTFLLLHCDDGSTGQWNISK
jgi:hypothetical protein